MIQSEKKDLVTCLVLLFEIKVFADRAFVPEKQNEEKDIRIKVLTQIVQLKSLLIQLNSFLDFLNSNRLNKYIMGNQKLIEDSRDLKNDLQFIKHLRNHCCGHLDEEVVEKIVQWDPSIFEKSAFQTQYIQENLIYKAMLEVAINSFVDEKGTQKVFGIEIDWLLPEDNLLFVRHMMEITDKSINFLREIVKILDTKIEYTDSLGGFNFSLLAEAAQTDFRLKKKGR